MIIKVMIIGHFTSQGFARQGSKLLDGDPLV